MAAISSKSFGGVKRAGDTYYAYSGCPEGRGFDETGSKGVLIGSVGRGGVNLDFVPTGFREYGILTVDLSGSGDALAAVEELVLTGYDTDIYRVVLTGEYGGEPFTTAGLERALAKYFYHVVVKDETRIKRDLWAIAEEDTLTGVFMRVMRGKFEQAGDDERQRIETAVRFGLAALSNMEEPQ